MRDLENKTDEELLMLMKNGRKDEAFSELYKRYYDNFLGFSSSILGNIEDAEDAVQTGFIKIYEKIGNYKLKNCKLKHLIYTIIKNESINLYKKNKKDFLGNYYSLDDFTKGESDNFLENKEIMDVIKKELKGLEELVPRAKEIYESLYFQEMNTEEIAKKLKIKAVTVRVHAYRAKKKMKENISKKYRKEFYQ